MNSNTIFQAYKEAHLQRTEDIDPVDDYDDYRKRVRQEHKFASEVVKRLLERDALVALRQMNAPKQFSDANGNTMTVIGRWGI